MRGYDQLPGLDKAKPRQMARATITHFTKPYDDCPGFARMVMVWFDLNASPTDFAIEVESMSAQLLPLFLDAQFSQCDKQILISVVDGRPAVTVIRNVDPHHPERNLA